MVSITSHDNRGVLAYFMCVMSRDRNGYVLQNALVKTGMSVDVGPWTVTDVTPGMETEFN